jgi:uncharacterized protein YeaO (DUF488 family)
MIRIKRVYEPPDSSDGLRVLVDRLWPRGLPKEKARIDAWRRDLAPSDTLRRWFGHDPKKWTEFKRRYREELKTKEEELKGLAKQARRETISLLYSARDEKYNNAVVLKEALEEALARPRTG